jgi:O-antigen/teichoic acid export membrane protein
VTAGSAQPVRTVGVTGPMRTLAPPRLRQARAITRPLIATAGARLVVLPITAAANLVTARLITDAVGVELFGTVMLIATLSQVLSFADLGVGAPVATASAQVDGHAEQMERFRRTLLTALRTMLVSAVALSFVATVLGALDFWAPLLGVSGERPTGLSANTAALLVLLAFAVSVPFSLGEAVLRGSGRAHQAVLLSGTSAITTLVVTAVLHTVAASPLSYALAFPIGALVASCCCGVRGWYLFRAAVRGLWRQLLAPRLHPGSAIAATAAPWFIIMIGLPIALQTDRIIIAHQVDAVALSSYSYSAQVYTPIWSVVSVAALALWPVFASGPAGALMRRNWLTGMAVLGAAGAALALGFVLTGGLVIGWMSNGSTAPGLPMLIAFAALLIVQSLHVTTGIMLISPHQLMFQAVCVTALVVTNVPLSWVLASRLGATGPVVASVVTVAVCQLVPGLVVGYRTTRSPRRRGRHRRGAMDNQREGQIRA